MTQYPDARKAAAMLAALADPTRLRIAFHLARGQHHVSLLAELLGVPIVNMSHHLGVMRQSGLLDVEKLGRKVFYFFRDGILTPGDGDGTLATLAIGTYRVVLRTNGGPVFDGQETHKAKGKLKS